MAKNNYYTDCHSDKFKMCHPEKYLVCSSGNMMKSALEDYLLNNATDDEKEAWRQYVIDHRNTHGSWTDFVNTSNNSALQEDWKEYVSMMAIPEYKSDWERKMFVLCDTNTFVARWCYEPFTIAYHSPLYMKQSLYKPDIYLECRYDDGHMEKFLIEVKPTTYSVLPKAPKALPEGCTDQKKINSYNKKKESFNRKSMDVMVNYAKWQAAEEWCRNNGINWFIANEKNTLGLFDAKNPV